MKRRRDDELTPYATALLAHKDLMKRFQKLRNTYQGLYFYTKIQFGLQPNPPPPGYDDNYEESIKQSYIEVRDAMDLYRYQLTEDLITPDRAPQEIEAMMTKFEKQTARYQYWLQQQITQHELREFEVNRQRFEEMQVAAENREQPILLQEEIDEDEEREEWRHRVGDQMAAEMGLRRDDVGAIDDDSYEDNDPNRFRRIEEWENQFAEI